MKFLTPNFWLQKNISLISIVLFPIAILLQFLKYLKKELTHKKIYEQPIICIGNIYLGGTGKTPLSIKVYELLAKKLKKKICIVRKNYKNHQDEYSLIKSKIKNFYLDDSRVKAIDSAIKNKCEVIILDDGYQDYSIKKNLNIICFNSNQLIGNGLTIPSGPLRESLNNIKNCQIVIVNGEKNNKFEKKLKKINKNLQIFYSYYKLKNSKKLKKKKYIAFAGIGNPQNFFKLLKKNKIFLTKTFSFPDHYNYKKIDIELLKQKAKESRSDLLTTQKDYLRLNKFYKLKLDFSDIELRLNNEKLFLSILKRYI